MSGFEHALLRADWAAPPGVMAFTTLRHGAGVSRPPFDSFNLGTRHGTDGDDPDAIARNRGELLQRFGLPSPPRWLRQVHGTTVANFDALLPARGEKVPQADEGQAWNEPEADAAVTRVPGTVLAILSADCLPVVFAAADGSAVAAAHAGWRGLAAGVLEATVMAMQTLPEALIAWLGPAAGPRAYEVGEQTRHAFVGSDPGAGVAFTATRPGHWRVDLYALARRRLATAGIAPDRIHGGGLCTIGDPQRFYSHRRDGGTGRMATLVWRDTGTGVQ